MSSQTWSLSHRRPTTPQSQITLMVVNLSFLAPILAPVIETENKLAPAQVTRSSASSSVGVTNLVAGAFQAVTVVRLIRYASRMTAVSAGPKIENATLGSASATWPRYLTRAISTITSSLKEEEHVETTMVFVMYQHEQSRLSLMFRAGAYTLVLTCQRTHI